jgi:hypothetical protein
MDTLVTVHGVSTDGAWQEQLDPALAPHFRHVAVKYRQYRFWGLGALSVPLDLVALVVGGIVVTGLTVMLDLPWWVIIAGVVVVVALGWSLARERRRRARRDVRRQLGRAAPPGARPNLVAHSFGTALTADVLEANPEVQLGRLILVGSVLPRSYPWQAIQSRVRFRSIWNEVGRRDWVVRAAIVGAWMGSRLGWSGIDGFDGARPRVHPAFKAGSSCSDCAGGGTNDWVIHNCRFDQYTHSEAFISPDHAIHHWLPVLWGFQPAEILSWWTDVTAAHLAVTDPAAPAGDAIVEQQVLKRKWAWAGGTLDEYLRRVHPGVAARVLANPVARIGFFRTLWERVVDATGATEECASGAKDAASMTRARWLHPAYAVIAATETFV